MEWKNFYWLDQILLKLPRAWPPVYFLSEGRGLHDFIYFSFFFLFLLLGKVA